MRTVHWLFLLSVALFVCGIAFVIAGARAGQRAPAVAAPAAPATTPVADVRQIMLGIAAPAAQVVWNSVSTSVTLKGVEEKMPGNDAEWQEVAASAAALSEAGNLLMTGNRAVDNDEWMKMSRALVDAGAEALKAAQAKNVEGIFATGEAIYNSCDNCHKRYQRGS
jgi:hypothetical protein